MELMLCNNLPSEGKYATLLYQFRHSISDLPFTEIELNNVVYIDWQMVTCILRVLFVLELLQFPF